MMEINSAQPVSALGMAVRPTPPAPQPQVAKPTDTGSSRSAADYGQTKSPETAAATAREFAKRRAFDDHVLTGPPPSFQASLLEVENDINAAIARLNEARQSLDPDQAKKTAAATPEDGAPAPVMAEDAERPVSGPDDVEDSATTRQEKSAEAEVPDN